jgi:hypothetical protein
MGLLGRIIGALYPQPAPDDDPAVQDQADRGSLLSLTLMLGRRKVRLEIGSSVRSDDAEYLPPMAWMIPAPRDATHSERYAKPARECRPSGSARANGAGSTASNPGPF